MDILGRLAPGATVKTAPVAKALAGLDGGFAVRVDPTIPIQQFTEDNGTVNFSLIGEAAGSTTTFAFPRRLDSVLRSWVDPDWSPDRGSPHMADITLSLERRGIAPAGGVPAPAPVYKDQGCANTLVATYSDRTVVNGEVYTGPNATGQFVYSGGSTSTLGVGWSLSGSYGSYSQSGTASGSSTTTLTYPTWGPNALRVPLTSWQYGNFAIYLPEPSYPYTCYFDHYEVRPTAWWGRLDSYIAGSAPSTPYCALVIAGGRVSKDTAQAIQFTDGVDLSAGAVGVWLSSQTGFNASTKIDFVYQNNGQMCGNSSSGYVYSSRVAGE
jgi:hypothetical protein